MSRVPRAALALGITIAVGCAVSTHNPAQASDPRTAPTATGTHPSRFQPDGPPSAHPYRGPRWDRAHGMPACAAGRATQTTGDSASASHRGIPAGRGGRGSGDFAFPIAVASLAEIMII